MQFAFPIAHLMSAPDRRVGDSGPRPAQSRL